MNSKAAMAIIRDLGLTCRFREGEYRINLQGGKEATAYYTTDADDAIATARRIAEQNPKPAMSRPGWHGRAAEAKEQREQIQREILQFRVHLLSDKFRGAESVWQECVACGDRHVYEERKDWISTADVLRWLDGLESVLR